MRRVVAERNRIFAVKSVHHFFIIGVVELQSVVHPLTREHQTYLGRAEIAYCFYLKTAYVRTVISACIGRCSSLRDFFRLRFVARRSGDRYPSRRWREVCESISKPFRLGSAQIRSKRMLLTFMIRYNWLR